MMQVMFSQAEIICTFLTVQMRFPINEVAHKCDVCENAIYWGAGDMTD